MVAWLAGADVLLNAFKTGADPYKIMAALIFNVREADVTKFQRFIGKSAVLGLGYGMGANKFYNSVIRTARAADNFDMSLLDNWTEELAQHAVNVYRSTNAPVKRLWSRLEAHLRSSWLGYSGPATVGPMTIGHGYIEGPTGLQMRYFNPRIAKPQQHNTPAAAPGEVFKVNPEDLPTTDSLDNVDLSQVSKPRPVLPEPGFYYNYGGIPSKLYGAMALENISQHLAGVLIKGAAVRMAANGYNFAHQVHDELVYIVPTNKLTEVSEMLMKELTAQPFWAPGLPLGAEVKAGPTYGDAK